MKSSVELREERAALVAQARELISKAKAEDRELTAEEEQSYDGHMADVDKMKLKIDRMERLESAESDLDRPNDRQSRPLDSEQREIREGGGPSIDKVKSAYRHWLKHGEIRQELRSDQQRMAETRDTIIGTDAKGGYLVAPVQVTQDLVKQINDMVFIRQLATVRQVTEAKSLGIRKLTTRMADADWTTEVQAVTEDTTMAFGRRDLTPQLLSKLAKVSIRTIQISSDVEQIIRDELTYKFGITEEKAYLTGDGSAKPLGVFTASANGISTGRDVATGNTATAITGDGLINAKYSLKQGYLKDPSAAWIFHRDAVKLIRKLKIATTTGGNDLEYIWQPGLTEGSPDRILDIPYGMSEYAPSTFTTGLYVGVLGAFRYYWIAEVTDMIIQRLVELFAATNEVGYIARRWLDGSPVLEEAFARVKLG